MRATNALVISHEAAVLRGKANALEREWAQARRSRPARRAQSTDGAGTVVARPPQALRGASVKDIMSLLGVA